MKRLIVRLLGFIATLIASLSVSSCDPEGDIAPIKDTDIIDFLSTPPNNLKANKRDIYPIVVQISHKAADAYRLVTITCSKGSFSSDGDKDEKLDERKIRVEPDGRALVTWITPDTEGEYFITASIGTGNTIYSTKQQKVTVGDIPKNLSITVDSVYLAKKNLTERTIPGDGKTLVKINAHINPEVASTFKTLTFKCSKGEFNEEGKATLRDVKVDNNGDASVYWIVDNTASLCYISVSTGTGEAFKIQKPIQLIEAPVKNPSFGLQRLPGPIDANGVSVVTYEIQNPVNIPGNKLLIKTNRGILIDAAGALLKDGTLQLGAGQNTFRLRLDQTSGPYYVKVHTESGNFSVNGDFESQHAYAEEIFVSPNKLSLEANENELTINVLLRRSSGKVSIGTEVKFEVYQATPGDIGGVFDSAPKLFSNDQEKASVKYLLDRTKIKAGVPLKIRVTSPNAQTPEIVTVNLK